MTDNAEQSSGEPDPRAGEPDRQDGPDDGQADSTIDIPEIEDSNAPDTADASIEESVAEDDPELLDAATRAIEAADDSEEGAPPDGPVVSAAALADDSSDTESIADEEEPTDDAMDDRWDSTTERRAHRAAVELKRVESSVRSLLENRDTRRKRRLGGTRRWLELEEDILAWRHTGRIDEETLDQLAALIAKRHHHFDQLKFLSTVRPGWRAQPA